jgi:predicted metal-dependent peptidase
MNTFNQYILEEESGEIIFDASDGEFVRLTQPPAGPAGPPRPAGPPNPDNPPEEPIDPPPPGDPEDLEDGDEADWKDIPLDEHDTGGFAEKAAEQGADTAKQTPAQRTSLNQHAGSASRGSTGSSSGYVHINKAKPQLNWRLYIRQKMTMLANKIRLERRPEYGRPDPVDTAVTGVYHPQKLVKQIPTQTVFAAIDVSASVSTETQSKFTAEIINLAKTMQLPVTLLDWDTNVTGRSDIDEQGNFDGGKDASGMPLKRDVTGPIGGGGTEITCVKLYFEAEKITNPGLVIYLTDGGIENNAKFIRSDKLFVINKGGTDHPLLYAHENGGDIVKPAEIVWLLD